MDRKEIMTKAAAMAELINKNAKTGFNDTNEDGPKTMMLGIDLLTNLLVDINRIADAAEKISVRPVRMG